MTADLPPPLKQAAEKAAEIERLRRELAELKDEMHDRYKAALERIARKCKDNYWAAVAEQALRPKEAVLGGAPERP